MTFRGWTIERGNREHGGYTVRFEINGNVYGSYPVIKNPSLRFLYPWAVFRAMQECKRLARG